MSDDNKLKGLLGELDRMVPKRDKYAIIESRANHFITSGINLLKQIEEHFSPEEADELSRRLFNSLKGRDTAKFHRKICQLKEAKEKNFDE